MTEVSEKYTIEQYTTAAAFKIEDIVEIAPQHHQDLTTFGLSRGILGLSFLYHVYGTYYGLSEYHKKAKEEFEKACDLIGKKASPSFFLDISELGMLANYYFKKGFLDGEPNEFLEDIDTALEEKLDEYLNEGDIGGFVNGAISMGLYFLWRYETNPALCKPIMQRLIAELEEQAFKTDNGIYWKTKFKGDPRVYLTMPHGSAAIILLLTRLTEIDETFRPQTQRIVEQAIKFVLSQEIEGQHFLFSDVLDSTDASRLALCYGDMGVGYMLLRAGTVFANDDWYNKGISILENSVNRKSQEINRVEDASILFGATGLMWMFHKIYRITQLPIFKNATDYWLARSVEYGEKQESPYAGFKAAYNPWNTHTNVCFSEGIIGIGIAYMMYVRPNFFEIDDFIWLL